jgi:trehalose/maltose hydrolase-like predicted phosphorylase
VHTRSSRVRDADGRTTRITQRRIASMADPHILALETTLLAENWSGRVELRSGLDGNVTNSGVVRYRQLANRHLSLVESWADDDLACLQVETTQSRVRIALAGRTRLVAERHATSGRHQAGRDRRPGRRRRRAARGPARRGLPRPHLLGRAVHLPVPQPPLPGLARAHRCTATAACRGPPRAPSGGLPGAMFPWQSGSNGREETQTLHLNPRSGRWLPDGSHLQRHINAAIAYNVWKYYEATGDSDFLAFYGAELILEIARFWAERGQLRRQGRDRYEIRGVMGPDEFHDALSRRRRARPRQQRLHQRHGGVVPAPRPRHPRRDGTDDAPAQELCESLGLTRDELERWDDISRRMVVPSTTTASSASSRATSDLAELDWDGYRARYGDIHRLDRILEAEGDTAEPLQGVQAGRRADALLPVLGRGAGGDVRAARLPARRRRDPRNIDYYLRRTSHGSTLSGRARVGAGPRRPPTFVELPARGAAERLFDIQGGTTAEGIHLGAMAGTVDLVQHCYTGIERYRRRWVDLRFSNGDVQVTLRPSALGPIHIGYRGEVHELAPGEQRSFTA